MYEIMTYEEIENSFLGEDYVLVDVRSPSEFQSETIPGAINIPVFNDKERKIIGKTYKQESSEKAKELGITFISKKLPSLFLDICQLNKEYEHTIFFCARGGYRSKSIVALMNSIGIDLIQLKGGYKEYRNYIIERLPDMVSEIKPLVLYGNTGTGKTEILKHLKEKQMNVLDLEGAANHRGSTLGSVGLGQQTSQKMFESLIYKALKNRKGDLVFIEGESRRIGKDVIPKYLFEKMKTGVHVNIKADLDFRIDVILKDYVHGTDSELITSLNYLRKHLGDSKVDLYINLIKEDNYEEVIEELMLNYYDPMYEKNTRNFIKTFCNDNSRDTADKLIYWVNEAF